MKKLVALLALATIIPSMAHAADTIVGNEATPFVSVGSDEGFTWTGIYLGVQGGIVGGTLETNLDRDVFGFDEGRFGDISDYGAIGGAHVGYDYQIGSFVVGAEADIAATSLGLDLDVLDENVADVDYIGTVRAKLGYAVDRTMLYATGGMAYAKLAPNGADSQTEIGYTVGGGIEYAMFDNLSVRTEYKYTDIQDFDFNVGEGVNFDYKQHTVEAGLSYRFN